MRPLPRKLPMKSPSPKLALAAASFFVLFNISGHAYSSDVQMENTDISHLVNTQTHSRIGFCIAQPDASFHCVNGEERFSLQSVMKLIVGAATLAAVDDGRLSLEQPITLTRKDISVHVQPVGELVMQHGAYTATVKELISFAINDSDSAAVDVLVELLGGPATIQDFIDRKGFAGMRIDRDEKTLQSEIAGLTWQDSYTDPANFEAAKAAVPMAKQHAAYTAYQADPRDTTTPIAMTQFLSSLAQGNLLKDHSNRLLIDIMKNTRTGADRLRAGLSDGWQLANKTGTSSSLNGIAAATNDVGLLIAPDGTYIPIAVFVADSSAPPPDRAAMIAKICQSAIDDYTSHAK